MKAERARSGLEEILSQREYRVYYEDNRSILQIWWDNIEAWIAELLDNLFFSVGTPGGMANGVLIAVIAAVVLLLGLAVFRLIRQAKRKQKFRDKKPLQSMEEKNWSFYHHLSEAERQEGLEAYKLAVRHMFLALLLYFDEKDWLKARTWKTNGEYYQELRNINSEPAEAFYRMAVLFDEVTYGDRQLTKREYSQYRDEALQWISQDGQNQAEGGRE